MATKDDHAIDVHAYEWLKSVQKPTGSFSQTIKCVARKPIDLKAWFTAMDRAPLSRQAADVIARHVKARYRRSPGSRWWPYVWMMTRRVLAAAARREMSSRSPVTISACSAIATVTTVASTMSAVPDRPRSRPTA